MGKTGLVVEGGGMKCAYNAGILDRFLDENIHFDYCIGVSAYYIDGTGVLGEKDAPVDLGKETYLKLYETRIKK